MIKGLLYEPEYSVPGFVPTHEGMIAGEEERNIYYTCP